MIQTTTFSRRERGKNDIIYNNKRLVPFFEPHALCYFFLKTVVAKELLHYSVAKKTRTQTHTHTHYVCKTYGRNSRSEETGTGRESRDRCHLVRARIRDADVDAFIL